MDTNVKKGELLEIVQGNRDRHRGVFEAAVQGYRDQAERILGAQLAALLEGRTPEIRIILERPRDHTRDYDRVIKMLELDTRAELLLDERTFARYVMDQWDWTGQFLRMSSSYAAGATRDAYGDVEDDDF